MKNTQIKIVCGTGGVGKTSISAALGIQHFEQGLKVLVITIDPSKRLLYAILDKDASINKDQPSSETYNVTEKLSSLSSECLSEEGFGSIHVIAPKGPSSFENFIRSVAPNSAIAESLLINPIFQVFSREFSGTQEYLALEQLYRHHKSKLYDVIILDTPPSQSLFAFLDTPNKLSRFLDEKLIHWMFNSSLSIGLKKSLSVLEKLTGSGFMGSFFDFVSSFFELQSQMKKILEEVLQLLQSQDVECILVTTPQQTLQNSEVPSLSIEKFIQELNDKKLNLSAIFLNKCLHLFKNDFTETPEELNTLLQQEQQAVKKLKSFKQNLIFIPDFSSNPYSLEDLRKVSQFLPKFRGSK